MRPGRVGQLLVIGALTLAAGAAGGPALAASASHPAYARIAPAPRLPAAAHVVRATAASTTVSGTIALQPRDPQSLSALASAVSTVGSGEFHHYLAKGDFARRFGPTSTTLHDVTSTLNAAHLEVSSVTGSGLLVHFRGTAANVDTAFRTMVSDVRTAGGKTGRMPTRSLSVPASIAGQVQSVIGLDTLLAPSTNLEHGTRAAAVKAVAPAVSSPAGAARACPAAAADASDFGGLTDDQIGHAYGATGLYGAGDLGAGQHIGVYELEPFATSDLKAFDTCYYGAAAADSMVGPTGLSVASIDGGSGVGAGSGESILDVEDVAGLAPRAHLDVYEAPNTVTGGLDEWSAIINADVDQQISTSWGFCELDEQQLEPGYLNIENTLFEQAAAQGQSVLAEAGDSGSDGCAYHSPTPVAPDLSVGDPGSQPYAISVGGTTISNAGLPPTERVWNDGSSSGAAGGGISSVWPAPSWQSSAVGSSAEQAVVDQAEADGLAKCSAATTGGQCRQVPDVSAQADEFTGAITVYMKALGGWTTFGGTSSSTPLWTAMLALVNASSGCPAGGLGFVNPELYAVAAVPGEYAASFNDVKIGNNDAYGTFAGHDYAAAAGFDPASGLGTPNLAGSSGSNGLAHNLCAVAAAAATRPAVSGVSPGEVSLVPSGSLTITGSNFGGATSPAKVTIGGYTVPAADLTTTATSIAVAPIPTAAQVGTAGQGPQDGSGRYLVIVTSAAGVSSVPSPAAASLLYVDTAGGLTVPSVSGSTPYGGAPAGGNQITVFGSGYNSAGGVTGVTVGGVAASYTVQSDTRLSVSVPAYSGATHCATGTDPATDVCQAEVVVSNGNGSSRQASILPPLIGAPFLGQGGGGAAPTPPSCVGTSCENTPATTEYDYLALPTIGNVSPTYVSEDPSNPTTATITGSGFDYLGFDWVNVGVASDPDSVDLQTTKITPTRLTFVVNGRAPSAKPVNVSVSVQMLQGRSNLGLATYAGIPIVGSISPSAGPATGGTAVTIKGSGFQATAPADGGSIQFFDPELATTTLLLSGYQSPAGSTSVLAARTPASNPGLDLVSVCTVTGCSFPQTLKQFDASTFHYFNPGDPVVTAISKHSGPASGGNKLVIKGQNLSEVVAVSFGTAKGQDPSNPEQLLDSGSSTEITVVAPPGIAGHRVNVRVSTIESTHGGHRSAISKADHYTYRVSAPSAPRALHVKLNHTNAVIRWRAPERNGGRRITGYRVIAAAHPVQGNPHRPHPTVVHYSAKARSAHLHGLAAGWDYSFKIEAINAKGAGPAARSIRTFLTYTR